MAKLPNESGLLQPQPNRPFSIHVPDLIWIVQTGKLDLFLVQDCDGESTGGAREHVLRVEQGCAVFGLSAAERKQALILAVATPGTQLLCVTRETFQTVPALMDSGNGLQILSLLEDWISRFAAAATVGKITPRSFTELEPGSTVEISDPPKPIMPVKGVLWVEHLEGASWFVDSSTTERIDTAFHFPVSRYGWLQPSPASRISCIDSEDWVRTDPHWKSLQKFHDAILQQLLRNRLVFEDKNRKRLLSQGKSDAAIVQGALRSLATPLQKKDSLVLTETQGLTDPTLLACEAVGKSLGQTIVAPAEMRSGVPLKDPVASIARASGLRHRVVVLKRKWWEDAAGPLLAFRDADKRPMAVLPASKKGYELYDPVERLTTPVNGAVALTLSGFGYTFYRPLPSRRLSIWDLLSFGLHDAKRELLLMTLMGIGIGLLGMVVPIATGIIFDTIIPGAQRGQLLQISGFLVVTALATSMFTISRNFAMLRLEGKLGSALQAAVWDRLLRLPVPFFRRFTSGDLADRSFGIGAILRAVTGSVTYAILSGFFSMFSFLLLFYYSAELAVVAIVLVLVEFAVSAATMYVQVRYQRQILRSRGRISGLVLQLITNIAKLRVCGAEPRAFAAWAREFAAQKELSVQSRNVSNGLAIFDAAFPVISLAVIYYFGWEIMSRPLLHPFTTGSFLAFSAAFVQFQTSALQLTSAAESVMFVVVLHERAIPIFETLPEATVASRQPGELSGAIELNHVNFRYGPDMPWILRDLSLAVKPGQFVALVGPSGSGKSSLLRLLLGFERPESGGIYYDGQDLSGLDIQAVRRQFGVVLQSARVASGTIFENIAGSSPLSVDEVWEAARAAGLENDIRDMPMGMYTVVSEGGENLSGGQRQRLLIARAIVKKPRIFLFDEATSALDNRTQAVVSHSLDSVRATRIIIAHRLSTVVNANRIFVLEKGVVVQSGSYEELVSQEGLFRELARRQLT